MKNVMFKPIRLVEEKDCHIFKMNTVEKENPKGNKSNFIELKSHNWASAVVVDEDTDDFIMVEQYRHGINKSVIEFPCGIIEEGEDPLVAVLRECKEEVGLTDYKYVSKLYENAANPAFLNNYMNAYFIVGKVDKRLLDPDENEFINIKRMKFSEVEELVHNKDTNVMLRLAWEMAKNVLAELKE